MLSIGCDPQQQHLSPKVCLTALQGAMGGSIQPHKHSLPELCKELSIESEKQFLGKPYLLQCPWADRNRQGKLKFDFCISTPVTVGCWQRRPSMAVVRDKQLCCLSQAASCTHGKGDNKGRGAHGNSLPGRS